MEIESSLGTVGFDQYLQMTRVVLKEEIEHGQLGTVMRLTGAPIILLLLLFSLGLVQPARNMQ